MKRILPFYLFLILGIWACTPKTAQVIEDPNQAPVVDEPTEQLSPCKNFDDAFDPDDTPRVHCPALPWSRDHLAASA